MFSNDQIEELKNYFQAKPEYGTKLPNPKDILDNTIFYLLENGIYIEHIMFKNNWYRKIIDSDSNIVLSKV